MRNSFLVMRKGCLRLIVIFLLKMVIKDLALMGCPFESLNQEEVRCLECPLSNKEVFSTVSALNENKALRS